MGKYTKLSIICLINKLLERVYQIKNLGHSLSFKQVSDIANKTVKFVKMLAAISVMKLTIIQRSTRLRINKILVRPRIQASEIKYTRHIAGVIK